VCGLNSGAVPCAVEVGAGDGQRNAEIPPEKRTEFRIGINLGDMDAVAIAKLNGFNPQHHYARIICQEAVPGVL
jgi:hypothetical protein